jgi:multidrug efflux pump
MPPSTAPRRASSACRDRRLRDLQIYLGSLYVNDFNQFGRTYSVRAGRCRLPGARRGRGPAQGALHHGRDGAAVGADEGQAQLRARTRHALQRLLAADINGGPAPGFSGQAQAAVERIAAETLPPGIGFEWTELTYQEILAGNSAVLVFPIAILLVFLVLAAQYESLTLPLAIILIVPMGLLAAMTGVWLSGGDNNVFTQIG